MTFFPADTHRLEWIDATKGIAMLTIMNAHCWGVKGLFPLLTLCEVSVFFVLAGYTYRAKGTFTEYCSAKAKRLLIPFLFFNLLSLLIFAPQMLLCGNYSRLITCALGALYGRFQLFPYHAESPLTLMPLYNAPLWFLPAIFIGYILFRMLMSLPQNKQPCAAAGCFILAMGAVHLPILLPWAVDIGCFAAVCMYGGHLMQRHPLPEKKCHRIGVLLLLCAVYYIMNRRFGGANLSISIYGRYGALSAFPFLAFAFLGTAIANGIFCAMQGTLPVRFLAWVGRISLVLLCVHGLVDLGLKNLWNAAGILPADTHPICLICRIVGVLLFAYLWHRLCLKLSARYSLFRYL